MPSPSAQRYLPGGVPLFGAAHLVAMVASRTDHPVLPVLDRLVAAGGSADEVLAALQQWSAWGLPDFCICERTETGFRLLIRGGFEVRPDGETPITVREEPWADGTVTNEAVTVRALMDPPRGGPAVAFYGGSALASLVRFATGRAAEAMLGAPPAAPLLAAPPTPVLPTSAARAGLDVRGADRVPPHDRPDDSGSRPG
nr:hypothetical protein [Propionibacterium sp.]